MSNLRLLFNLTLFDGDAKASWLKTKFCIVKTLVNILIRYSIVVWCYLLDCWCLNAIGSSLYKNNFGSNSQSECREFNSCAQAQRANRRCRLIVIARAQQQAAVLPSKSACKRNRCLKPNNSAEQDNKLRQHAPPETKKITVIIFITRTARNSTQNSNSNANLMLIWLCNN